MKITHHLSVGGWIETVRGKGGGMRLAKAPSQINLGLLIRSIEPDFALVECFASQNACTLTGHCALTGIFNRALEAFFDRLDAHTLADVLPRAHDHTSTVTWAPLVKPQAPPSTG
jgi:Rrf2 family nitric oxide-sensitive transcriptional repressor